MENKADNKRFQVLFEKFGNQQLLKLFDSKTNEFVSILPETGGMLLSMEMQIGKEMVSILDCYSTETELEETLGTSFKGSNLFPFPNRIDSGKYSFDSSNHQLFVNFPDENNAIHGLIFDKPFKVIETNSNDKFASVKLNYTATGSFTGYPFCFVLEVEFLLEENKGLSVITSFTNTDKSDIPVANGWHPYFRLKSMVEELIFSFPSTKTFAVNGKMIPTCESTDYKLFEKPTQMKDTVFDTCFGLNDREGKAIISIKDPLLQGGISIWQETGSEKYNFLQIYTPPSRKTIAIEPMTSIPDSFNNKIGLIVLNPGKKITASWGVFVL
jgi:aldose 1-epimerase